MPRRADPQDKVFMQRALALAASGQGLVEPNPMVGAVIVRDGLVIGEGYHKQFGRSHAEVNAIRNALKRNGRWDGELAGATMYVSLEPCCHHGKTPPCTDALISAGISRVVAAMRDPFPRVSGGGFRKLRAAGVKVEVGLLEKEARRLNEPFIKRVTTGRPWVILKWAQSLDGKIATRTGNSKWITGLLARKVAHELRGRCDAIVVGVNTVINDNPALTGRLALPLRAAARVVLDAQLRTPPNCELVRTARVTPTLIFHTSAAPLVRRARLKAAGCELVRMKASSAGVSTELVLDELGRREMTNVMIEGGGKVLGSFYDAGLADEAYVFVAPRLIGGNTAPGPLNGRGPAKISPQTFDEKTTIEKLGPDTLYRIRFK